jgi:hypothetical protein
MMQSTRRLYAHSRVFILILALIELVLSYWLISLAIDRGNLWWYILSIFFFVRFTQDLLKTFRINNGKQTTNA